MEKIKNLLNLVTIISNKNAEILDATGGRFNMFRMCGVNHYENKNSAIIAEFLNPKGTHGLKSQLLECFIETLREKFTAQFFKNEEFTAQFFKNEKFTAKFFDYETSEVLTEHSTKEGRIDILLKDNQNKAIIIENKIYAHDQYEQLKRYKRYAEVEYKNGYEILYLTLFGNDASEQSGYGVTYLSISYEEDIINWLEKCVAIASRFPIVRETIIQYINHLKQLTNQSMDTKNNEEITEVLSKIENLRAAKVICQNYTATFNHIIKKRFNPGMEKFAKEKGMEYTFEKSEEYYVRFYLKNSKWQGKCWIYFTFEGDHRFFYGIANNPKIYRISNESIKILHEQLNKLAIHGAKENDWWPFSAYFPNNLSLETWESDIINSDNFLNDCKEKIEKLLTAMESITI